jgi:hypothetical protein
MQMPDCILKHWPNKKAFVDGARKALKNNHDELTWKNFSLGLKISDLVEKQE